MNWFLFYVSAFALKFRSVCQAFSVVAAMFAAAMVMASTIVAVCMVMAVMVAMHVGIICERIRQECLHRSIRIAANTAVKTNPRCRQGLLSAAADSAANECINRKIF